MLMRANLFAVFSRASRLAPTFAIGSLGTAMGAVIAACALSIPLSRFNPSATLHAATCEDGWKIAAALAAKNIGGGLNYVAVATTLRASPAAVAAGIVVDNVFALVYFPLVSWLGRNEPKSDADNEPKSDADNDNDKDKDAPPSKGAVAVGDCACVLALASGAVACGRFVSPSAPLPIATVLAVTLATIAPSHVTAKLAPAAELLGQLLLFVFFATAGAAGGSIAHAATHGVLFGYLAIVYVIHGVTMGAVAGLCLRTPLRDMLVASNANSGGAATAASLASGRQWHALVVPGQLVGHMGNACATFIGLGLSHVLRAVVGSAATSA